MSLLAKKGTVRKISFAALQTGLHDTHNRKGWLKKQGGRRKNWKLRLFILNDNILYYFKTENDKEPKGVIPLSGDCRVEFVTDGGTSKKGSADTAPELYSLKIHTPWRVYWFCNSSLEEVNHWVSACTQATKMSATRKNEKSLKEGWIAKSGNTFKSWKLRYMVLSNDSMSYYERPDSDVAKGCVALLNATIHHTDPAKTIKPPKLGHSSREETNAYLLYTNPEAEADYEPLKQVLEFGFKLTNDIRSYQMYALKQSDCDHWLFSIQKTILEIMSRLATSRVVGEEQIEQDKLLKGEELSVNECSEEMAENTESVKSPDPDASEGASTDDQQTIVVEATMDSTEVPSLEITSPRVSTAEEPKLAEFTGLVAHFITQDIQERESDEKQLKSQIKERNKQKSRKSKDATVELTPINLDTGDSRQRSRSAINQSAISVLNDSDINPKMIPIKLKLRPGVYIEDPIKLTRPIEIEGSGVNKTIITLSSDPKHKNSPLLLSSSHNVCLRNLTLRIYAGSIEDELLGASKLAQKKSLYDNFKAVIHVTQGTCFLQNCRIVLESNSESDASYDGIQKTCGIIVTNEASCYLEQTEIDKLQYGIVVSQLGLGVVKKGHIRSKLNPLKKVASQKCDIRMYGTKLSQFSTE